MSAGTFREDELIGRLFRSLGGGRLSPAGIGDDAAWLLPADGRVIAHDMLVQGIHFSLDWSSVEDAAFKALAVNVSDLWAMGAEPRAWLLGLALPVEMANLAGLEGLVHGFEEALQALDLNLALVGGDTVRTSGPLTLAVTVIGEVAGEPLVRSGARPGCRLWVDGPLGWAAAGLHLLEQGRPVPADLFQAHARPRPRRLLAVSARAQGIVAAMDLSDGLVRDAARLAQASGVALVLDAGALSGAERLQQVFAAESEPDKLVARLQRHGGDDYVRLVASTKALPAPWMPVGRVEAGEPGVYEDKGASWSPLVPQGFEHF